MDAGQLEKKTMECEEASASIIKILKGALILRHRLQRHPSTVIVQVAVVTGLSMDKLSFKPLRMCEETTLIEDKVAFFLCVDRMK